MSAVSILLGHQESRITENENGDSEAENSKIEPFFLTKFSHFKSGVCYISLFCTIELLLH